MDQAPASLFAHHGPPGWARSTSRPAGGRRYNSRPALSRWGLAELVFGFLAGIGHLHDFRVEAGDDVDEVRLRRHHLVDVLVDARRLVNAGRQKLYARLLEHRLEMIPPE